MQYIKRHYDPILLALLNLLGVVSFMGFVYCLFALFSGMTNVGNTSIALYLVWFSISMLSVYVMRLGDVWGAYALGFATLAITFYDLLNGFATVGGGTLGISVMLIVYEYIMTAKPIDELAHQPSL